MKSILTALSEWSRTQPDKAAWIFLNDKGLPADSYTFGELDRASSFLADLLISKHKLATGSRILLVFFPGLDFTVSLLACFKAGLIAVPVFPPDPRRLKKDLRHFVNIQDSSGASVVLTNAFYHSVKKLEDLKHIFSAESRKWPELQWIQVDDALKRGKHSAVTGTQQCIPSGDIDAIGDTIAFLQYTSGSTSDPKGVMISHGNLAHNLSIITAELKTNVDTVNVSWLPQYHDMGLIGSYLGALFCGGTGYYLSPISFLKDPVVWIKSMSTYKATHTQAPNFAFALVSRKFEEAAKHNSNFAEMRKDLDLSNLKHMINAAEPVDLAAIDTFYSIFGAYKLPTGVVYPTYGLAEHTVFVCSGGDHVLTVTKQAFEHNRIEIVREESISAYASGGGGGAAPAIGDSKAGAAAVAAAVTTVSQGETQNIVGCGYPFRHEGTSVVIVKQRQNQGGEAVATVEGGEVFEVVPDLTVGEIWIDSQSKAKGYWGLPDLTRHDFHGHLTGAETPHEYLRSGDLGFLHNGELFICGRVKDLIIVRGTNHYPQDIERSAEQCFMPQTTGTAKAASTISASSEEQRIAHNHLRAGCSAAFSVAESADGAADEYLVYVAELKEGVSTNLYQSIVDAVRETIATEHGIALRAMWLLKPRTVPKTTSGKIARAWCKKGFLASTLDAVFRWQGQSDAADAAGEVAATMPVVGGRVGESGYQAVPASEPSAPTSSAAVVSREPGAPASVAPVGGVRMSKEAVRSAAPETLIQQLGDLLMQIAMQSPTGGATSSGIDPDAVLSTLGFDSMSLVQFHGALDNRYYCENIPDEFFFSPVATLRELAVVVKTGTLTADQRARLDAAVAAHSGGQLQQGEGQGSAEVVDMQKEPLCPWFTCCY